MLVVVALAAAVVGAEQWLKHRALQQAADRLAEHLDADVEVHVVGGPLTPHVARRHLPSVMIVIRRLPIADGRAELDELIVHLEDLRLVGTREDPLVTAGAGRFTAHLAGEALARVVPLPSYLTALSVIPNGLRLLTVAGVAVDARVRLEPNSLLVRPTGSVLRLLPQPSFRLPLPRLPYGARAEDVVLRQDAIDVTGTLDADLLTLAVDPRWGWVRARVRDVSGEW